MRFPRFRIRTLMIAVAVAALLSATPSHMRRRSVQFSELAQRHHKEVEWAEFELFLSSVVGGGESEKQY